MRKPIQYQMPQYQPVAGHLPPITIRDFKGINTFDPFSIPDNMFTDIENFTTSDYPTLTVRPGYTVLGSAIGSKVIGLGSWKDEEIHAVFNDGTWRKWNGSTWQTLKSGLDTSAEWTFVNYQGGTWADKNLVGSNGVDGLHRYDGSTVQTFGDAPSDINFVCSYQNRIWGASGATLHACALDRPEDWQDFAGTEEDSFFKDVESSRGENNNMLSGGLTKLVIGFPNSVRELYGGVPSDFNDRLITEDEGFANNKSAVTHEGIMHFMHKVGFFQYTGGVIPDKTFSEIVDDFYPSITDQSAAGTDGTRVYFNLPPDTLLVYDARVDVQTWTVWKGIQATRLILFNHELHIGDAQGRVLKLGGTTDAGADISAYAITKPFTSQSAAQKQKWIKLWTHWELAAGSTLNIYLSDSESKDDWELMKTITGIGEKIDRIVIPIGRFSLANMIRIKFEVTGWAKMREYTRQIRLLPLY